MSGPKRIVIVGVSAAGLGAAEALRRRGYDGALTLIGNEPHLPYDRPPLSKQILAGTWEPEKVVLRSGAELAALDADVSPFGFSDRPRRRPTEYSDVYLFRGSGRRRSS